MIKTIKVMLLPNNKQKTKLWESAGTARFAYNWALNREQENYNKGGKFLSDKELRKEFTVLKTKEEYKWLNDYSNNITKQAIKGWQLRCHSAKRNSPEGLPKDACNAYQRFFKGKSGFPKFKSRKKSRPSFYVDTDKIQFTNHKVKLEKITTSRKKKKQKQNWIRLAEKNRVPADVKYSNPRVTFDGIHWWVSVGMEFLPQQAEILEQDGIGIDLGIQDLAVCSDKNTYKNINKTKKVKKLEKRKSRLQRCLARKYKRNKEGENYCKTNNIIKGEQKLLKLNHRLTNLRLDYLHQTTNKIINRKPRFLVLEDLNVKGMMKNKHLSKAIQQQGFGEFRRQIEYKSEWTGIKVIIAERFFPSSKVCYCCGKIKKDLKLSDRIYRCECGNVMDRDYQAALNLKRYGENILKSVGNV